MSQVALLPKRHAIRVSSSGRFPSSLVRPCGSLSEDTPALRQRSPIKVVKVVMALRPAWVLLIITTIIISTDEVPNAAVRVIVIVIIIISHYYK
jgi:hypothetical protein